MDWISAGARLLLVGVFAVAAVGKLLDRPGSERALRDFRVPDRLVGFATLVLPLAEAAVALGLIFSGTARWAAVSAVALLGGFAAGIAGAMRRGEAPECHCFGQLHSEPAGAGTLVRNGLLAALAAVVVADASPPGLVDWLVDRSAIELVAVVAGLALAVAAFAGLSKALGRRRTPRPLKVGARPPAARAFDADGESVAVNGLAVPGRPCVLAFVSPQCGPCLELLPELARWQDALTGRLAVHVISSGSEAEQRELVERHGLTMWREPDHEVSRAFRVPATPAAVMIGPDGRVASETTAGLPAIEALVRIALNRA